MPAKDDDDISWGDEPEKSMASEAAIDLDEPEYEGVRIAIAFKWSEARTDPIDFKPYSPLLLPQDIFIIVEVPESLVLAYDTAENGFATKAVLSLEGYAYVQHKLSLAIKKAYYKGDDK